MSYNIEILIKKRALDPSLEEWAIARSLIVTDKNSPKYRDGFKLRKNYPGLKHSFMCIDGQIYCLARGELIGLGSFGKVKEVINESGQRFALKIENFEKITKSGIIEPEIMAATGSLIASVVRFRDKATRDKDLKRKILHKKYQLMILHDGRELGKVLEQTGDAEKELFKIMNNKENRLIIAIKILEAINWLHSKGIVHGDIKPENVLLSVKDGTIYIRIIDFGYSQFLTTKNSVTLGIMGGTYGFMAPEVIRSGTFSIKSDTYALGVLFESSLGLKDLIIKSMTYEDSNDTTIPTLRQVIEYLYKNLSSTSKIVDKIRDENQKEIKNLNDSYSEYEESRRKKFSSSKKETLNEAIKQAIEDYKKQLKGKTSIGFINKHSNHSVELAEKFFRNLQQQGTYINALKTLSQFLKDYDGGSARHSLKTLIVQKVLNREFPEKMSKAERQKEIRIFEHEIEQLIHQYEVSTDLSISKKSI